MLRDKLNQSLVVQSDNEEHPERKPHFIEAVLPDGSFILIEDDKPFMEVQPPERSYDLFTGRLTWTQKYRFL